MVDKAYNEAAMRRRIEQAQREREAAERAEQVRQQKEAARRKPHCSGEMSDIERRILSRATRHQRALAEIRSGRPAAVAQPSARQQWQEAVERAVVECRGDRVQGVRMANQQNPGLREAMIAEVNAGR